MKCLLSVNADSPLATGSNGVKFTKAGNRNLQSVSEPWKNPWRLIQSQEPALRFSCLCLSLQAGFTLFKFRGASGELEGRRGMSMENSISNSHPLPSETWRQRARNVFIIIWWFSISKPSSWINHIHPQILQMRLILPQDSLSSSFLPGWLYSLGILERETSEMKSPTFVQFHK